MKVALVAPEFIPAVGGVGTYSTGLALELARLGIEVHVFTPNRKRSASDEAELKKLKQAASINFVSEARDFFLFNLWFQQKLPRVFNSIDKKEHFDLVHAANLAGVPDIFLKAANSGVPSIVTAHSTIESQLQGIRASKASFLELQESEKFSLVLSPFLARVQSFYLKKTKNIIAVSNFIKKQLAGNPAAQGKKIFAVHNGVDTKKFSCANKEKKSFFASMPRKKKVLFFGRLLSSKGIKTFFEAMPQILRKCKDTVFVFAGQGNTAYWKKQAEKKGIEKNCVFLGTLAHGSIPSLLNECDIVVLPSFSESLPLTVLEAMACKKPVIATNVGGIPEIISNNSNGLLFKAGNAEALAEKTILLLENEWLAKKIGKKARKTVEEDFTVERMALQTLSAYKKALGQ